MASSAHGGRSMRVFFSGVFLVRRAEPTWSCESGVEDSTEQIVIAVSYSCYKREMNGVE